MTATNISQPKHLVFPKAMHMSRNHYKRSWSLKTFRRIKNVIVLMDWVPDVTALKPEPPPPGRHVSCLCFIAYYCSELLAQNHQAFHVTGMMGIASPGVAEHPTLSIANRLGTYYYEHCPTNAD